MVKAKVCCQLLFIVFDAEEGGWPVGVPGDIMHSRWQRFLRGVSNSDFDNLWKIDLMLAYFGFFSVLPVLSCLSKGP